MSEIFQNITVQGLYDDATGLPIISATGAAAPTSAILVGGSDGTNLQALKVSNTGVLSVSVGAPSDTTVTGSITNTQNFAVSTQGASTVGFNIEGTWTGTIVFETSQDGTNWVAANAYSYSPWTGGASSTTTNGQWIVPVGGFNMFRVRGNTVATGSATVWVEASQGHQIVQVVQPTGTQLNASVTQNTTPWVVAGNKTNNAATSNGTNLATLPAIATTAAPTYATGNVVALSTDTAGSLRVSQQGTVTVSGTVAVTQSTSPWVVSGTVAVTQSTSPWVADITQWANVALGAPANFGTTPGAVVVASANVSIFQGTAAISATNPLFNEITDGTNAMGAMANFGTSPTAVKALNTNSSIFAGTTALTATGSSLNVDVTNTNLVVVGNLTNNNAAPTTTNVGVLGFVATATPEAWTQGDQTLGTVTLGGSVRVTSTDQANASSLSYFSYDNGGAYLSGTGGTAKVMWSIQANSASIIFFLRELQWFTDGSVVRFQLLKNGTLTGSTFAATSPSTNVQVDTAATSVTGGTVVMSGYVGSNPRSYDTLQTAMASGAPGDKFTMVGLGFGSGTVKMAAQIRWSEQAAAL